MGNEKCARGLAPHRWFYDDDEAWRICWKCGANEWYRVGAEWGECANGHLRLPHNRAVHANGKSICLPCARERKHDPMETRSKVDEAAVLLANGASLEEAAKTAGVSVRTARRARKA